MLRKERGVPLLRWESRTIRLTPGPRHAGHRAPGKTWVDGLGFDLGDEDYITLETKHLEELDRLHKAKPKHPLLVEVALGAFQSPLTPLEKYDGTYSREDVGTVRIVRRPSGDYHLRLFAPDAGFFFNQPHDPQNLELIEGFYGLVVSSQHQVTPGNLIGNVVYIVRMVQRVRNALSVRSPWMRSYTWYVAVCLRKQLFLPELISHNA